MIFNIFNLIKVLNDLDIFDESVYIIDSSINKLNIHINSVFDVCGLICELEKKFKKCINYSIICMDLIIYID